MQGWYLAPRLHPIPHAFDPLAPRLNPLPHAFRPLSVPVDLPVLTEYKAYASAYKASSLYVQAAIMVHGPQQLAGAAHSQPSILYGLNTWLTCCNCRLLSPACMHHSQWCMQASNSSLQVQHWHSPVVWLGAAIHVSCKATRGQPPSNCNSLHTAAWSTGVHVPHYRAFTPSAATS